MDKKRFENYVANATLWNRITFPFIGKQWKKIKYILILIHITGLLTAWNYENYLILIINVILQFIYNEIDKKRMICEYRLETKQKKYYIMHQMMNFIDLKYLDPNFYKMLRDLDKELYPGASHWGKENQSVPLRIWLWTKSKILFQKRR